MTGFRQDLAFAVRALRRRPVTAVLPMVTLAIGIGASTAVFSVVDAVLLEDPAYREPDRLVLLWHRLLGLEAERARVPGPDVAEYERQTGAFEGLAFVGDPNDLALVDDGRVSHVRVGVATPNLFDVLGVRASLGRTFRSGEGVTGAGPIAAPEADALPGPLVLAHGTWRTRFGEDPGVLGRIVRLGGTRWQVVGVLPADFELLLPPGSGLPGAIDAWTPLATPIETFRRPEGLRDQDSDNTGIVIGRLAANISLARARAETALTAGRLRAEIPAYRQVDLAVELVPLVDEAVRHARTPLIALSGAVLFVLLIACSNVANLLLVRGVDRRSEMALRSALGAARGRLVRQVFTEAGVLGVAGAALGVLLAVWGIDALLALSPEGALVRGTADLSGRVLGFAVLTTLAATLIFGSAPAAVMARSEAHAIRSSRTGGRSRLSRGLVVSEVALSFALLVGAGLMMKTSANLERIEPGFDAEGLVTLNLALPAESGGPAARARLIDSFERRVRELPGVEAVGVAGGLPLGDVVFRQPYGFEGSIPEDWSANEANFRVVTAEYFRAMGTRLLAGRAFTPTENVSEDERVAIVDASLAARLAPDGGAVGRTLGFPLDGDPIFATVVGVVEDVRFHDLREAGRETIYVPYRQEASRTVGVAIRTRGAPEALAEPVREIARSLAPESPIPVYELRLMESYVARALAPTRFALTLIAIFAGVAICLAGVGVFGVISYAVSRRRKEFGIRIALGAGRRHVLWHVLGAGLGLAGLGVAIGVGLALASASALRGLLFQVGRADPTIYIAVAVLMVLATVLATWLPARRAASVEPLEALADQ